MASLTALLGGNVINLHSLIDESQGLSRHYHVMYNDKCLTWSMVILGCDKGAVSRSCMFEKLCVTYLASRKIGLSGF